MEDYRKERQNRMDGFLSQVREEDGSRLRLFQKKWDSNIEMQSEGLVESLSLYFDTLVYFLEKAIKRFLSFSEDALLYSRIVEEIYLWNCVRKKDANEICILRNHPIWLINENVKREISADLGQRCSDSTETESKILNSIFDAKNQNREKMRLFCRNQVYETSRSYSDDFVLLAKPFEEITDNTKISVIRLWEKLEHYNNNHTELLKADSEIKVAVFGKIEDDNENQQKELLYKLTKLSIKWMEFEHQPKIGEYYFISRQGKQLYDLLNIYDLQRLVEEYQIILFMDLNCLYRQRQADKTTLESSEGVNCRWYFEQAQKRDVFRDKAAYYQAIYDHVGMWINSLYEKRTAFFEFDEKLYRNLRAVSGLKTDIYLYIKYGNKIGPYNIAYSGICNDEYYDGRQLTVCKITKFNEEAFNKTYREFLKRKIMDDDFQVHIKIWKLVKSISNEYCNQVMKQYKNWGLGSTEILLKALRESYLVLKYKINAEEQRIELKYQVILAKIEGDMSVLEAALSNLAEVVLKYAVGEKKFYCVNWYFRNLLVYSIISNANDMADLVFAHLLSQSWMNIVECENDKWNCPEEEIFSANAGQRFRVRKIAYAFVERLERLRMRNNSDMQGYFFGSFRSSVCPEMDDESLIDMFHKINDCCKWFGNKGSSLYVNSGLIDG